MVYINFWQYFHLWNFVLCLKYTVGVDPSSRVVFSSASTVPTPRANATGPISRFGNQRDLMLVLPVMQGNAAVNDPRLQFWYTKSPVTVVIEDNLEHGGDEHAATSKVPRFNSTGATPSMQKQHTQLQSRLTSAPATEAWFTRQTEWKSQNPKSDASDSTSTRPVFDIPQTVSLSTTNDGPTEGGGAKLEIVPAESRRKAALKAELLKAQSKTKSDAGKSTPKPIVLPSSTRFHYQADFVPIESYSKLSPSLPPTPFRTHKPTVGFRFPEATTPPAAVNSLQMYEQMKRLSLKPLRMPDADNMEPLFSPDREYFNVLADFSVPPNGAFQDRTKSRTAFSADTTQPWTAITYPPTEAYNLSTHHTQSTVASTAATTLERSPESSTTDTATSTNRLTDDFKLMLVALGILPDNETSTTATESNELWRDPDSFTIDPHSYVKFKKIPTEREKTPIRQDMQTLLDSFGLLPKDAADNSVLSRVARQSELVLLDEIGGDAARPNVHELFTKARMAAENATTVELDTENVTRSTPPPPLQFGLNYTTSRPIKFAEVTQPEGPPNAPQPRVEKKITKREQPPPTTQTEQQLGTKFGDPTPSKLSDKRVQKTKKKRKRQHLLGLVFGDRLQTARTTPANDKIERTMATSTSTDAVKRDSNTAPLDELATSFGGEETATDESADDLSTPKPNGLYFFVDWNTFLNVADGDKSPIRVRFSPRVGNARNFVPVVVP